MQREIPVPLSMVFALGFTMMLGPFAIDTYLPAFPQIAESLGVDIHAVALSISVYMAAFAIGQLVGGALSDHFGRRRILVIGLLVFSSASFLLTQVDSLSGLLGGRVLQALGAGGAAVSIPALVRDRVHGLQAAKLFSMIGLVAIVAPAIAPGIGSLLLQFGDWQIVFAFLGLYALALLPLLMLTVFRGSPGAYRGNTPGSMLSRYRDVLRNHKALPHIGWQTSAFAGLIIFVTYASYIYQLHYERSERIFALLFACNIVAMFCFNLGNRLLLNRFSPLRILQAATAIQIIGALALVFVAATDGPLMLFLPAIMLYAGALGAISPNNQACYLEHFPRNSGTASALMGTAQFGIGGLLSGLTTLLPHTLLSIALCITACALSGGIFLAWSLAQGSSREMHSH